MSRLIFSAMIPLTLVLATAATGQDKKDKAGEPPTDADYRRLATMKKYTGQVSVGPKSVRFRIDNSAYVAELRQAAALPTLVAQKQAIYKVEQKYAPLKWALGKEFELPYHEKVSLRKKNIPFEYDEKGFPKTNKLVPNVGGPGYPAKLDDFSSDAVTIVTFGPLLDGKPTALMLYVENK